MGEKNLEKAAIKELVFRGLNIDPELTEEEQDKYSRLQKKYAAVAWDGREAEEPMAIRKEQSEILLNAENRLRRQFGLPPKDISRNILRDYLELK